MNLKRITKESEEEDGFDWAREIDPNQHIEFRNAVIGKTYRVEFDEILLDALDACNHSTEVYFYAEKAKVTNIDYEIPYNQVYCGSENEEEVISLYLKFDLGEGEFDMFWVTDDMVTLYDIYENLNESEEEPDPFDWIRDTEPPSPHVPQIGMEFKIKNDEETGSVIYTITDMNDTHMSINWIDPSDGEYMENYKWPLKHYFGFVNNGEIEIVYGNLKKIIKEEIEDFTWMIDEPLNPWSEYDMIIFDQKPTKEEINNYIELALNTKNPENKESWEIGRKEDLKLILNYFKKYGGAILEVNEYKNLVYGDPTYVNRNPSRYNSIKYSQLVSGTIKESEEDDWAWARGPIWVEKVSNGDRIRVHNKGKKDAFINWLGMYSDEYLAGDYGVNIEGVVSETYSANEFSLDVVSGKSGFRHSIYFPLKSHMEFLSSVDDGKYNGLNLTYEFIPKS